MFQRLLTCSLALLFMSIPFASSFAVNPTVLIRTTEGKVLLGVAGSGSIHVTENGKEREIGLHDLLSYQSASPASETEAAEIKTQMEILTEADKKPVSKEKKDAELAATKIAEIGIPAMTTLLQCYDDPDCVSANGSYRYRLFRRIMPGIADSMDRTQGMIRLSNGEILRGNLSSSTVTVTPAANEGTKPTPVTVDADKIRSIAVLKDKITKTFDLDSRVHCTALGYLDAGIVVTPDSTLTADVKGFVRISFDEDGWASDADGIHDPIPGKRRLQEGFRWASVLGRIGGDGERWFVGKHVEKSDFTLDRLFFVINENERWSNNIGNFRMTITVTNAFDVAEPF